MTTIRRYRDLSEAIVARSLLESSGIDVVLCDENLIRLNWQISNFVGGIRLQVEAEDETDAVAILDAPIPESFNYGDGNWVYAQPRCPKCESTDITFEGSGRGATLASLYVFGLPLPVGKKTWLCQSCAHRWDDED